MSDFNSACTNPKYKLQTGARADYVEIAKDPRVAQEFLKLLSQLQMSFVHLGVSCIVETEIYDEINSLLNLKEVIPPFALGARMCIQKIRNWERDYAIRNRVECIFEQGDFGQGNFTKFMIDEGGCADLHSGDFAGLQAADQYAWEQFNFLRRDHLGINRPYRGSHFLFFLESIPQAAHLAKSGVSRSTV